MFGIQAALYWLLHQTMSFTLTASALEKSDPFLAKGHEFPLPGEGDGCPALLDLHGKAGNKVQSC